MTENNDKIMALLGDVGEYESEHKVLVGDFNLTSIKWENLTCKSDDDILCKNIIENVRDC